MSAESIRNFCIIAHIDHGKSTLADRLLQRTEAISTRQFRDQVLDDMDLERERGITIKAKAVSLTYPYEGNRYELNLIDTPGHVDFSYEVSRSLASCEGALLLVDAAQGVEAQTVANLFSAWEAELTIIPVLNKIDLPNARPLEVISEMESTLGIDPDEVLWVSAKTGEGMEAVLHAVVNRIPPPKGNVDRPLRALVFDSVYDDYRGVITYVRVFDGHVRKGDHIRFMRISTVHEVLEVGNFKPAMTPCEMLSAGEVGYLIANIKSLEGVKIGDTVTIEGAHTLVSPLPGYKEPLAMVYCGLYPADTSEFEDLRKALSRLRLNDSSFTFEPEVSDALGFGFRCGFLGLLHMDIVQERLERESNVEVVQTAPTVTYQILTTDDELLMVYSPADLPEPTKIKELREPIMHTEIICPKESIGVVMALCEDRRGTYLKTEFLSPTKAMIEYKLPLSEVIFDFYDKLKSGTRGYGTLDYEFAEYRDSDLVKLDILIGGKKVDALSLIIHSSTADRRGRALVKRLRKEISRHLFEVPIQAAIGSRVIARETLRALAKNVTSKCYGGDVTRKRKLLEKQKAGKKRMKQVGNVSIPQRAFRAVLRSEE